LKQFILNNEPDKEGFVRLEGNDYRYLVRVRRLAVGEYFPALLPNGEETLVQVLSIDHNSLNGKCSGCEEVEEVLESSPRLPPVILFQALPKGDKMDLIVRQAAEGGITEIVPFVSEFSVAKTKNDGQKFSRWERIIKEARQQSGSRIATTLHKPLIMKELFDYWQKKGTEALGLLFHHDRNFCVTSKNFENLNEMHQKGLEQKSLHGYLDKKPKTVVLVIGPEGGFSDTEVSRFLENDFKPLTIGDTILRTETAALYCAAAIRIILLERDSWKLNKAYLTK
jgi:16S rRNA (uracil1498-N3)-methyltransferase